MLKYNNYMITRAMIIVLRISVVLIMVEIIINGKWTAFVWILYSAFLVIRALNALHTTIHPFTLSHTLFLCLFIALMRINVPNVAVYCTMTIKISISISM